MADLGSSREDVNALEEAKGDINSDNNARQMNARQLIARKAEYVMQKDAAEHGETVDIDDGVPDDDLEGGVSPAYTVTDDSLKTALKHQPEQKKEPEKPKTYQIKVNGQEITLSEQELIERAQKVDAADRYLAEKKREADLLLAEAKLKSTQSSEHSDVAPEVSDEDLELVRAIQIGDEHTAAKALKAYISSRAQAQPAIPMDAIVTRVNDEQDHKQAEKWFFSEYKEIANDPKLMMLASNLDAQYRTMDLSEKKITPYMDRYRAIGEEIRKWKGTSPEFDEKVKQKRETIKSIPQASVRNKDLTDDDEPSYEQQVENAINEIAKNRGQRTIGV